MLFLLLIVVCVKDWEVNVWFFEFFEQVFVCVYGFVDGFYLDINVRIVFFLGGFSQLCFRCDDDFLFVLVIQILFFIEGVVIFDVGIDMGDFFYCIQVVEVF